LVLGGTLTEIGVRWHIHWNWC